MVPSVYPLIFAHRPSPHNRRAASILDPPATHEENGLAPGGIGSQLSGEKRKVSWPSF
jgi:hypothetical protein